MLRQISNLVHLGRIRTSPHSSRKRKPTFFKEHPELEINNPLELVAAQIDRTHKDYFFIQVGAFDGRSGDPLYNLIRNHQWQGILVEPQKKAFEQLKKNYANQKQLQLFNVAIGPNDGEIKLYTRKSGPVSIASTERHFLIKPRQGRKEIVVENVPCWTFQTLLNRAQAPEQIDLLQIDAEGFDYEIIRSINFGFLKPKIIRYEHVLLTERDKNACLRHLAEQGYRFLLEDMDTTALLDMNEDATVNQ